MIAAAAPYLRWGSRQRRRRCHIEMNCSRRRDRFRRSVLTLVGNSMHPSLGNSVANLFDVVVRGFAAVGIQLISGEPWLALCVLFQCVDREHTRIYHGLRIWQIRVSASD